jgi:hypothetical protein
MSPQVGDEKLMGIADDDMADTATAVYHQAKLPAERPRHLSQAPAQLLADPLLG